jgi:hypothetical protein
VANALYMVLFDDLTGTRTSIYRAFAENFISGYSSVTQESLDTDELRRFVDLRVAALQSWLDQRATAPVGVRNSSPSWRATLKAFVREYHRLHE